VDWKEEGLNKRPLLLSGGGGDTLKDHCFLPPHVIRGSGRTGGSGGQGFSAFKAGLSRCRH